MKTETGRRKPEKIEITDEMIEAGSAILRSVLGGAVSTYWDSDELAVLVFEAMIQKVDHA